MEAIVHTPHCICSIQETKEICKTGRLITTMLGDRYHNKGRKYQMTSIVFANICSCLEYSA